MIRLASLLLPVLAMAAQAQPARIDPPAAPQSGMPYMTKATDGTVYLSWLDPEPDGGHALRYSQWTGSSWNKPETVARGKHWFVNYADFPALAVLPNGTMYAHWLARAESGGKYGYGIKIARRAPGGAWREIHGIRLDDKEDYAGFLAFAPDVPGALYLSPPQSAHATGAGHTEEHIKTARYIAFRPDGAVASDQEVDADVCACCQTSVARTSKGLIAAYRDHLPGEIRDISVIRMREGRWSKPQTIHNDGWVLKGCPSDGPSIASHGSAVGIAWLTRAQDKPRIQLALSQDLGGTFGAPIRVDDGNPLGHPAVVPFEGEDYLAVWLEKKDDARVEVRLRRIENDGSLRPSVVVGSAPAGRAAGLPKLAVSGGRIIVAWRDERIRAASLPVSSIQ